MTRRPNTESWVGKFYCMWSLEFNPGQQGNMVVLGWVQGGAPRGGEGSAPRRKAVWEAWQAGSCIWLPVWKHRAGWGFSALVGVSPRDPGTPRVHTAVHRPGAQGGVATTSLPAGSLDSGTQLKRSRFHSLERTGCLAWMCQWLAGLVFVWYSAGWLGECVMRTNRIF